MYKEFELNLEQLDIVGKYLIDLIQNDDCIVILRGDLASGKTTLVKNIVKNLGLKDLVTSPTFSLQAIYSEKVYHYDVYNKTLSEFIALGMLEEFEKQGIHFVEWGDEELKDILDEYGYKVIVVEIEKKEEKRFYKIDA